MTAYGVYHWMTILLCIGVFQNSLGDLLIAKKYPAMTDFELRSSGFISRYGRWLSFFYESPGVLWGKIVMMLCAASSISLVLMVRNPAIPLTLLLLLQMLTYPRWRHFVGSDSPLLRAVLFTLILHYLLSENQIIADLGLTFVSAYLGLIYFFTGIQKFRSPAWRGGGAIIQFAYKSSFWAGSGLANGRSWLLKAMAWGVIFFELGFVLGFFHPVVAIGFMILGFSFHAILSVSMGINHFFWTFLACYPAYFYTSGKMLLFLL